MPTLDKKVFQLENCRGVKGHLASCTNSLLTRSRFLLSAPFLHSSKRFLLKNGAQTGWGISPGPWHRDWPWGRAPLPWRELELGDRLGSFPRGRPSGGGGRVSGKSYFPCASPSSTPPFSCQAPHSFLHSFIPRVSLLGDNPGAEKSGAEVEFPDPRFPMRL